jgi:hypothetical protein
MLGSLHVVLWDGWPFTAFGLLGLDDTEYATGYSALGFLRVRPGMTEAEVLSRVGEPLNRYAIASDPELHGWRWTRTPHDGNYSIRCVLFRHGRVVKKVAEYYLD